MHPVDCIHHFFWQCTRVQALQLLCQLLSAASTKDHATYLLPVRDPAQAELQ